MSRDTREMDFAHHRQLFLTEQGYSYEILDESDLAAQVTSSGRRRLSDRLGSNRSTRRAAVEFSDLNSSVVRR